jgi:hypothetical protein
MTSIIYIFKCENPFCVKDFRVSAKSESSKNLLAGAKRIARRDGGVFVNINNKTHFFCCKDCKQDFVNQQNGAYKHFDSLRKIREALDDEMKKSVEFLKKNKGDKAQSDEFFREVYLKISNELTTSDLWRLV